MPQAKGILQREMVGETLPQVFTPTIQAVQRRNNCPTRHPSERIHSFSLEIGCPGQDIYWSPGHPEMSTESKKWSLVVRPQQANQRSC